MGWGASGHSAEEWVGERDVARALDSSGLLASTAGSRDTGSHHCAQPSPWGALVFPLMLGPLAYLPCSCWSCLLQPCPNLAGSQSAPSWGTSGRRSPLLLLPHGKRCKRKSKSARVGRGSIVCIGLTASYSSSHANSTLSPPHQAFPLQSQVSKGRASTVRLFVQQGTRV